MVKKVCWNLIIILLLGPSAPVCQLAGSTGSGGSTGSAGSGETKSRVISISMLIPGVEQFKNKHYVKGTILLGAFAGSIAGAISYNHKGIQWYDKYRESMNVEDIVMFRQETEKNLKRRNYFIAGIFSVWLIHIIDLKFFKPDKTDNNKGGGITGFVGQNEINLGFYYSF